MIEIELAVRITRNRRDKGTNETSRSEFKSLEKDPEKLSLDSSILPRMSGATTQDI
jgi:hypothetical protein